MKNPAEMPRKLGIIAGSGLLPVKVAAAARAAGRGVFIVGLEGFADPGVLAPWPHEMRRLGAASRIIAALRENGCQDLVMIGPDAPGFARDVMSLFVESMVLWGLISPFIIVLCDRLPLDRGRRVRSLLAHVMWALVFAAGDVAVDAVFGALRASGALTDARVWDRLAEAASAGNTESAASAAALLEGREREAAERIIGAVRNPATTLAKAEQWPDDPRARDAIAYGLARYARRDSASAETLWSKLGDRFKWDAAQKDRVLNALAIYLRRKFERKW